MNKMLMFPITFMLLLTVYAMVYTDSKPYGQSGNYSSTDTLNMTGSNPVSGSVDIPKAGKQSFSISSAAAIMLILLAAIGIGIVAGITILGSGLKGMSQSLIFNSILFLGLWACLTIVSSAFLFDNVISMFLYIIITIIYVIGLGTHMSSSGVES